MNIYPYLIRAVFGLVTVNFELEMSSMQSKTYVTRKVMMGSLCNEEIPNVSSARLDENVGQSSN